MRRNKQKSKIAQAIDLAEDIFREHYVGPETRQACFYWARAGLLACRAVGLDAVPQAGSVQWQIQHEDSENNAFAYSWQGLSSEETRVHASNGYLPEMHCWFALPREQVIVDLTAGFQRENCRRLTGLAWDDDLSLPRHIVIGHGPRPRHQHRCGVSAGDLASFAVGQHVRDYRGCGELRRYVGCNCLTTTTNTTRENENGMDDKIQG